MLLLAPLVNFDNSENNKFSSNLEFFGSQAGDDCENETKDDDLPFYVNKDNGSDDNSGSENCPFATIAKAAETIGNGDTVIISHGIYRESISLQDRAFMILHFMQMKMQWDTMSDDEKAVKKTEMKKQWEEYLPMSPEEKKQKLTDYIQSLRN